MGRKSKKEKLDGYQKAAIRYQKNKQADQDQNLKPLSPRECEVVSLLVGGLTRKEVAEKLGISTRTVDCYIHRIQIKTEQPTVIASIAFTLLNGMVLVNSV